VRNGVQRAIYDASLTFGMPYGVLYKIARCESNLNPNAAYAGHYGLFQFLPQTFSSGSGGMRSETGITANSYWNALDASYVAGYLFVRGKATAWSCMRMPPA
jgi:soluble lytic murein transglycosylase-like protein